MNNGFFERVHARTTTGCCGDAGKRYRRLPRRGPQRSPARASTTRALLPPGCDRPEHRGRRHRMADDEGPREARRDHHVPVHHLGHRGPHTTPASWSTTSSGSLDVVSATGHPTLTRRRSSSLPFDRDTRRVSSTTVVAHVGFQTSPGVSHRRVVAACLVEASSRRACRSPTCLIDTTRIAPGHPSPSGDARGPSRPTTEALPADARRQLPRAKRGNRRAHRCTLSVGAQLALASGRSREGPVSWRPRPRTRRHLFASSTGGCRFRRALKLARDRPGSGPARTLAPRRAVRGLRATRAACIASPTSSRGSSGSIARSSTRPTKDYRSGLRGAPRARA